MTTNATPQVGDRVRIVHEGEVREVDVLRRHVTLVGVRGTVPLVDGRVEILATKTKPCPVGTVAISGAAPRLPAVRDPEGWGEVWGRLTDDAVRRSPFWTIVHEPSD
jgi:hypothetical protein